MRTILNDYLITAISSCGFATHMRIFVFFIKITPRTMEVAQSLNELLGSRLQQNTRRKQLRQEGFIWVPSSRGL